MALDPLTGEQSLRADLLTPSVSLPPGSTAEVELQILNTSDVIEQVQVNVLGIEVVSAVSEPVSLTLFPAESARLKLALQFHRQLPAGQHTAILQVLGRSTGAAAESELLITVPPEPAAEVTMNPPVRRAGKKGQFTFSATNLGNTNLSLLVRATDADQKLTLAVDRPNLNLTPGQSGSAQISARHKRPMSGDPLEHVLTVTAEQGAITESVSARFIQKPRITAGMITVATITMILLLWAVAMYFGVRAALAGPPPTKAIPESFAEGVGIDDFDAIKVGGRVTGAVRAASTAQALPRITVEAFDLEGRLVTAAATNEDGVYELGGLLPIRYQLRFRGTGVVERWWPASASQAGADPLFVVPDSLTEDIDIVLSGAPARAGGRVIAGEDDPIDVTIRVEAVDLLDSQPAFSQSLLANADGTWAIEGLPSPALYRFNVSAAGYDDVEITQPVNPGETLVINTVRLPAAVGVLGGLVVDRAGTPLGGVAVEVQRGEFSAATVTPTAGEIGVFSVIELSTPATYLVTFSAPGYSSETIAVRLNAGENLSTLNVVLAPATGTVTGLITDLAGLSLGGVDVIVSGGGTVLATASFTSGDVGAFRIGDLPLPGTYTVTFEFEGYLRETLLVQLDRTRSEAVADVVLRASVGRVSGVVVDEATGDPVPAATIIVSDGASERETTTASAPLASLGRFSVGGLVPAAYTITVKAPGRPDVTILETVRPGEVTEVTIKVPSNAP
jgi:hypothetical protein